MTEPWHIRGEYLESCNCEVLCPCLLGPRNPQGGAMARPTEGNCCVPLVFHIEEGRHGSVALGGTRAAAAVRTPGPMGEGNWTFGLYIDERGTPEQRNALEAIFSGQAGGIMSHLAALVTTRLPTRVVPIQFGKEGRRRWASIPGVLDLEVEGIEGREGKESEVWLDNVRHFVSRRLAAAKTTRGTYRDHEFSWNHAGRNAHYTSFEWSGP